MGDEMATESKKPTKSNKRKRGPSFLQDLDQEKKQSNISALRTELDSLFSYFKEVSTRNEQALDQITTPTSINSTIACLLEESELPFSKLVDKIHDKIKTREQAATLVWVRGLVLLVGQRTMYGVANAADAHVLEDDSQKSLWCWETRDLKLLPKTQRPILSIRRTCRKKIQDRICAVSTMINALQVSDSQQNHTVNLMRASEKLVKVLNEADIRQLVEKMVQKSDTGSLEKEAKIKETVLAKELERNKRELDKEKKRMEREHLKEKLQKEKEQKRLQDEAKKEERLWEAEINKQNKRQQEEAERNQRRREKEEAQQKHNLSLKKQATLMERFLKSKANDSVQRNDSFSSMTARSDSPRKDDTEIPNGVTLSMDSTFSLQCEIDANKIHRLHRGAWNKLGSVIRSENLQHWGMRQKPKTALIKELKLQGSSSVTPVLDKTTSDKSARTGVFNAEKVVGWVDNVLNNNCHASSTEPQICNKAKKLLQFDKSHRPAYYGTLSAESDVIGPRHPLEKDPNLDYDVDSDEEWEEEDPGESLSDCDKDEEEECLVDGNLKADDGDESEDDFFVPDGYLSENEGVQVDSMETDLDEDIRCSPHSKQDLESEEFQLLCRHQKYLHNLTEVALQKNQPIVISNLMYEKTTLLIAKDLNGTSKLEQMFLQTLSLRPFPGGPIEISTDNNTIDEDQDVQESKCNGGSVSVTPVTDLLDKELCKVVWSIQSCSYGIKKVVESLQQSFPAVPKSQLRNKVREVSVFVDNRWQVKKEILDKLGDAVSPEKSIVHSRGIAAFFSKRCLPPTGGPIEIDETSPQRNHKPQMCNNESCPVEISE